MRIYTCLLKTERLQVGLREAQSHSSGDIKPTDYDEGFPGTIVWRAGRAQGTEQVEI